MGLLTYAYDPVGTANVLVHAAQVGAERQAATQKWLAELARSLSVDRRRDQEFDRQMAYKSLRDREEDRRWTYENSPMPPTAPTSPASTRGAPRFSSSPASSSPAAQLVDGDPLNTPDLTAGENTLDAPQPSAAMPSPSQELIAASDAMGPDAAKALATPMASAPGAPAAVSPEAAGAQQMFDEDIARRRAIEARKQAARHEPAGGNLPMRDAQSKLAELGTTLSQLGVSRKSAESIIGSTAKALVSERGHDLIQTDDTGNTFYGGTIYKRGKNGELSAVPKGAQSNKVRGTFVDPEMGTMHTQFADGTWDSAPEDPARLQKLAAPAPRGTVKSFLDSKTNQVYHVQPDGKLIGGDGQPAEFPDDMSGFERLGSKTAEKQDLAGKKFEDDKSRKDATTDQKSAESKAKFLKEQETLLLRYRGERRKVGAGDTDKDGHKIMTADQKANADALDGQIRQIEERISASGGVVPKDEGEVVVPPVSPAVAPAATGDKKTIWRIDRKTGIRFEYDAETNKPTGAYKLAPTPAP